MYRLSLLAAANSVQRTVGWRANQNGGGRDLTSRQCRRPKPVTEELSVPAPDYMHTHTNGLFVSRKRIQKTK